MAVSENESLYSIVENKPILYPLGLPANTTLVFIFNPIDSDNGIMFIPRIHYCSNLTTVRTVSIVDIAEYNESLDSYVTVPTSKLIGSYAETVNAYRTDARPFMNGIGVISTQNKLAVTFMSDTEAGNGVFIVGVDAVMGPTLLPIERQLLTNEANSTL